MCGIFGWIELDGETIAVNQVKAALSHLHHRGPDDEGYLLFDPRTARAQACGGPDTPPSLGLPPIDSLANFPASLVFGFRRLAILDLSPAGHQPMPSPDGQYWILLNGEIYNYLELRSQLLRLGRSFKSGSDTEVLLAAYQQWGPAVLERLVGMFSLAILDCARRSLFLARDFFGIKPLYYHCAPQRFAFASEPQALLALPWFKRSANPQALDRYLRFGRTDVDEQTFFDGLLQLQPGHCMELDLNRPGSPRIRCYWRLKPHQQSLSMPEAVEGLRARFEENIRLHLRSDVPVGAALSGGIDSSAIVMAMRSLLGQRLDLHTFSYIAEGPSLNEEKWIDLVSAAAHARVHKTYPRASDLVSTLDDLIRVHGEPFTSTSIFAQYTVFQAARRAGIVVMEDGQGADEMLAGYPGYLSARLASLLRQGRPRAALSFALAVMSARPRPSWVDFYGNTLRRFAPEAVLGLGLRLVGRDAPWLNKDWFARQGVQPGVLRVNEGQDLMRAALVDSFTSNLPMLLRYEDRNSMAFSIESRVPFLTPGLVQYVLSLPENYIINERGVTKYVFRQAMQGIVPAEVLNRTDKIGFATPEQRWLKELSGWVDQIIHGEAAHTIGALNLDILQRDWHMVRSGRRPFTAHVWRWINLIRWLEHYQVDAR